VNSFTSSSEGAAMLRPMQARTYALTLVAAGLGLFLAVVATNLVIDPTGVFGTRIFPQPAFNDRYAKFNVYQSHRDRYDGVLLGSSRSFGVPFDELSRHMPEVTLADFGVPGGMLTDYMALLEYMLRHPPSGRQSIREIFLLLDADSFGRRPFTDESLQFALPPGLTNESLGHFYWRNLIAIQPKIWRNAIKLRAEQRALEGAAGTGLQPRQAAVSRMISLSSSAARAQALSEDRGGGPAALEKITERPLYPRQLDLWRRFVTLSRQHDIRLIAALSPLSRANESTFDRTDLAKVIDDIARVAPVWDFTEAGWVAEDRGLWLDTNHFKAEIGRMMIARIFGEPMPPQWTEFGRFRPQQSIVMGQP
jgi:hypothetical protein